MRNFLCLVFLFSMSVGVAAQTLQGRVLGCDDKPVAGAVVYTSISRHFALADGEGRFSIAAVADDSLTISFTGFETRQFNPADLELHVYRLPCRTIVHAPVVVARFSHKATIGYFGRPRHYGFNNGPGQEVCIFIRNQVGKAGLLQSILLPLMFPVRDSGMAVLLRFRALDSASGAPGAFLTDHAQLEYTPFTRRVHVKINEPVLVPVEGFFLSLMILSGAVVDIKARIYYLGTSGDSHCCYLENMRKSKTPYFVPLGETLYASAVIKY